MELVADGLDFPEGPIICADGSVLLVEIRRKTLTRVLPNGTIEAIAAFEGGPNGAAIGPDGHVYICNNGGFAWSEVDGHRMPGPPSRTDYSGGSLQRVDLQTGSITTLYTACDGLPLMGPNDLVFDREGGIWFTDVGKTLDGQMTWGGVFYALPDGSHISRQRQGLFANGIGLSPDETKLHVAETRTGRLWTYNIEKPGVLAAPASHWNPGGCVTLPGYQLLDSLAVEGDGKVCVATLMNGGITIVEDDAVFDFIEVPGDRMVTNICFGGEDMRDAWITSSGKGQLLKTRWPRPGLRLNYNI